MHDAMIYFGPTTTKDSLRSYL